MIPLLFDKQIHHNRYVATWIKMFMDVRTPGGIGKVVELKSEYDSSQIDFERGLKAVIWFGSDSEVIKNNWSEYPFYEITPLI